MITGDLKSKIDKLWEEFWVGGITNPLTVIEQITYLMYSRMLDTMESKDEQKKALAGVDFKPRFKSHQQDCRFSQYCNLSADEMMEVVRDRQTPTTKCSVCTGADGSTKDSYQSKAQAKRRSEIINEEHGIRLYVYQCDHGNGWHLTKSAG